MKLELTLVLLQPLPSLSVEAESLLVNLVFLIGDVINLNREQYRIIPLSPEDAGVSGPEEGEGRGRER